jgi:hypothetical protein
MPIQVRCECGRELLAKDEYAGRRTTCPDCGRELLIPDSSNVYAAPRAEEFGPPKWEGEPTTSGKAIASLVLGLCSFVPFFCCLTGIPALILGVLGLNEASRSHGRIKGQGFAIAGIVTGSIGSLFAIIGMLIALLLPAVQAAREAARRAQCVNNLKQIGLAMHYFHDAQGHFPPAAIADKTGKPLLSWRVAILPLIERKDLYDQFHLDEPWDSPHNQALISQMPPTFKCPSETRDAPGETRYLAIVGPAGPGRSHTAMDRTFGSRFADIVDGTSNTILVAESSKGVPWTKPEDLEYDPGPPVAAGQFDPARGGPLPEFGSKHPGGFNALIVDGSVRFIKMSTSPVVLKALLTRDGGEVVSPDF